ncbi:hypothetical protein JRQ81_010406 [Phrynocephalus forsythii]|uniref:Uncharacterized protein n=1 Tax=Phrynocephalus forsythii TaxID=171643 RepID=A0A9Q1ARV6_9SAUR|nr:hypothetical protein JRQ81_010406 [Phrynocephalus forsythii]
MRYTYGALVLTSLLLHKELDRGPALHSWDTGGVKDAPAQPLHEDSRQLRFVNTFRPALRLSWLPKPPWGANFLGLAVLLFCLLVEWWASSRGTTWPAQPQPARETAVRRPWARARPLQAPRLDPGWQLEPEFNPELETEQDEGQLALRGTSRGWLSLPHGSPSSCCTFSLPAAPPPCASGMWLASSVNSYEPPWEAQRLSPVTYKATLHGQGSRTDGHPEDDRPRSPLRGSITIRTASCSSPSSSSSSCSCPFSSPSSSSSSSSPSPSPSHLEQQDWHSGYRNLLTAVQDSLGTRQDSTDELESQGSDRSSKLDDPHASEVGTLEHSYVLMVPQRPPEMERVGPRARALLGHFPEGTQSWALPPFAQLNFQQSSAYGKENGILLVAKSLEIHIGPAPVPVRKAAPPKPTSSDQRRMEEETPTGLTHCSHHVCFLGRDAGVKHRLHDAPEEALPRASPKSRWPPKKQGRLSGSPCKPKNVDPGDWALRSMREEVQQCLESHVRKKMVQRQCGLPSVVVWSLRLFHALEDYHLEQLESRRPKATPKGLPVTIRAGSPNRRGSPAGSAKRMQRLQASQAYDALQPPGPEKAKEPPVSPLGTPPGLRRGAASQGPRAKYVLLSVDPGDLRRLLFHLLVKMLDIKRATFPAVVENSFQSIGSLSMCPLPKLIHWGIKTPRPKGLALPFVAGEALYLIDLNIRHKYLLYTWKLPAAYVPSTAERDAAPSWQPRGPKGAVVKAQAHAVAGLPVLLVAHSKGKVLPAGPLQLLSASTSRKPPSVPPPAAAPVEATPPEGGHHKPPDGHMEKQPEENRPQTGVEKLLHLHLGKSICLVSAKTALGHGVRSGPEETLQGPTPQGPPPSPATVSTEQPLSQEGGTAGAQEGPGATGGADAALKGDRSREAKDDPRLGPTASGGVEGLPPETEGQLRGTVLPPPLEKGEEVDRRTGAGEAGGHQLEIEGELCCMVPPPSLEKGGSTAQGGPGGQTVALPSSAGGREDPAEKGEGAQEKREGRGTLGVVLPPLDRKGAGADGKGAGAPRARAREDQVPSPFSGQSGAKVEKGLPRAGKGRARQKEGSIARASLFLEIELAKEKLNLHLKKKLAATLRPPHRAALCLDLDLAKEAGRTRALRATHRRDRAGAQAPAQPGRPFCYICMPLDEAGSQVKRVCWYLPKWILEMNGHRVPQVVHFESEATSVGQ